MQHAGGAGALPRASFADDAVAARQAPNLHVGCPCIAEYTYRNSQGTERYAITEVVEKLIREALKLAPMERATLIEELLSSLDKPDSALDAKWAQEAEDRLGAYRAGEIESTPAHEVFAELDRT